MSKKQSSGSTFKVGRNAGNGQFIPVQQARQMGNRAVVETMKISPPSGSSKRK